MEYRGWVIGVTGGGRVFTIARRPGSRKAEWRCLGRDEAAARRWIDEQVGINHAKQDDNYYDNDDVNVDDNVDVDGGRLPDEVLWACGVLQVSVPPSSKSAVKKGFHAMAMRLHPDKGGDPQQIRTLIRAKEILGAWMSE